VKLTRTRVGLVEIRVGGYRGFRGCASAVAAESDLRIPEPQRLRQRARSGLRTPHAPPLRKFGNRGSHEDESVNPATSAILSNVNALRALQDEHLSAERRPDLQLLEGGAESPPTSA
jgi:hypothetical protein